MNDLMNVLNNHYAGDTVTLSVYRNGSTQNVSITLTAQADS
jgi:S1-C subfamily serine protease